MTTLYQEFPRGTIVDNRYEIRQRLGAGGMGQVYLANDLRLGNDVVIKQSMLSHEQQFKEQFEREARMLANLGHPGLPRVTDHFVSPEGQFLVMQFVPGYDLGQMLLHRGSPFPPGQVLAWAQQLLNVLGYLHTRKPPVIHRDIKPENIKLNQDGQVVLLDFGLAKAMQQGSQTNPRHSIYAYTKNYAPPEQINGLRTDARSDLYAAAATLYHLLTGQAPVDASIRMMGMSVEGADPLLAANRMNPEVPASVAAALTRAMSLDANRRPQSAAQMWRELEEAVATIESAGGEKIGSGERDEEQTGRAMRVESTGESRRTEPVTRPSLGNYNETVPWIGPRPTGPAATPGDFLIEPGARAQFIALYTVAITGVWLVDFLLAGWIAGPSLMTPRRFCYLIWASTLMTAIVQCLFLRRRIEPTRWIIFSVAGALLPTILFLAQKSPKLYTSLDLSTTAYFWTFLVYPAIFGLFVAGSQLMVLVRNVRNAWYWVPVTVAAGGVVPFCYILYSYVFKKPSDNLLVISLITGAVLGAAQAACLAAFRTKRRAAAMTPH